MPPVRVFRAGWIEVNVWKNDFPGKDGKPATSFGVTARRRYRLKTPEGWVTRTTSSFRDHQLAELGILLDDARRWIRDVQAARLQSFHPERIPDPRPDEVAEPEAARAWDAGHANLLDPEAQPAEVEAEPPYEEEPIPEEVVAEDVAETKEEEAGVVAPDADLFDEDRGETLRRRIEAKRRAAQEEHARRPRRRRGK